MGTRYTSNSDTGYNSSPPPDNGTTGTDNLLTWAKHKTKLADPIRTNVSSVNTDMVNYVDWDTLQKASAYTTLADDDNRVIECTSSPTITLGAPATMLTGYTVTIKTVSGTTTVNTGGNNVDGSSSNRSLTAGRYETYRVNSAAGAWLLVNAEQNVLTSPVINTGVSGTAFLDEDDLVSDSATKLASQQSIKAYVDTFLPSGAVMPFAFSSAPTGWLECDGSAVSRTVTYADLFSAIGTSFGTGDGSTTFNLPDLRGQFVRGFDNTAGTDPDAATRTASGTGGSTGDNVGSVQADGFKAHTHGYDYPGTILSGDATNDGGKQSSSETTTSTGGNETRPTNIYLMYCIKI